MTSLTKSFSISVVVGGRLGGYIEGLDGVYDGAGEWLRGFGFAAAVGDPVV